MNVATTLVRTARAFGQRPAITWGDLALDYDTLNRRTAALAEGLRALGVVRGDRVALLMHNRPELLETIYGTLRTGAIVVPCNARSTSDELRFVLQDARARVIVTDSVHRETVASGAGETRVLCVDDDYETLTSADADPWAVEQVSQDEIAWLFYTSGTTGRPKGAMLSHGTLNFVVVGWLAELTPMTEESVTLHAAPLSHGAGFHALAATARGAHQVVLDSVSFDPARALELMDEFAVTNTWLVPTQIIRLTAAATASGRVAQSLRHVVYGGAPIAPSALDRALQVFGPIFVQLYAQGETPMTATVLPPAEHLPHLLASAGRARLGVELRVVDGEGAELPMGEVGEVVIRGPSVMTGYWNRPDATEETLRKGWLHTGDLGRIDASGYLFVLDRTKDMIISGGSNVYAAEVEATISSHPTIEAAAVVGVPDDLWGERVEAVVVMRPGAVLNVPVLDNWCRKSLADYKVPRRYHTIPVLPMNAYGKILKSQLRDRLTSRV